MLQSFLMAAILKNISENTSLKSGISSLILAMIGLVLSPNYLFVFVPLVFVAYGTGISRPILTSKLTNSVPNTENATVLGVNNSLVSLGQILAPILGGAILEVFPPITVPLLSATVFVCILIIWPWVITKPAIEESKKQTESTSKEQLESELTI